MVDIVFLFLVLGIVVICAVVLHELSFVEDTNFVTSKKIVAVPRVNFQIQDLPTQLVHRYPKKTKDAIALLGFDNQCIQETHYQESLIARADMVIPKSAFERYAQEGVHLFFTENPRTLVEIWHIGVKKPKNIWLESLRDSIKQYDVLFDEINHTSKPVLTALKIIEAYLLSPIPQFQDIAKLKIQDYLHDKALATSAKMLVATSGEVDNLPSYLSEHLLYWAVNGQWYKPIQVGILRQKKQQWIDVGIWSQVLHLMGRLVVLAPEARKLHGQAAGTWSQLRGALREIVKAYIEQKNNNFKGNQHLPDSALQDILLQRERWPAWSFIAGRRNLWRVLEPLAKVEPTKTKLGLILAKMRQESWQQKQLSLEL